MTRRRNSQPDPTRFDRPVDANRADAKVLPGAELKALPIYDDLLGLEVVIDELLGGADERTHWTFLQGCHSYGKIALARPLNYEAEDLTPFATVPNIGYIAQAFEVPDLN
jgi:hypothetical protein